MQDRKPEKSLLPSPLDEESRKILENNLKSSSAFINSALQEEKAFRAAIMK